MTSTSPISAEDWVFVGIRNPGRDEQVLGQADLAASIAYIPIFRKKDDAQLCLPRMFPDPALTFEVQAILFGDILEMADGKGYHLYLLDARGTICDRIAPPSLSVPERESPLLG